MSNLRISYLQKEGGGIFVQAIPPPPPPKKVGGGRDTSPHPPGIYASDPYASRESGNAPFCCTSLPFGVQAVSSVRGTKCRHLFTRSLR